MLPFLLHSSESSGKFSMTPVEHLKNPYPTINGLASMIWFSAVRTRLRTFHQCQVSSLPEAEEYFLPLPLQLLDKSLERNHCTHPRSKASWFSRDTSGGTSVSLTEFLLLISSLKLILTPSGSAIVGMLSSSFMLPF